MRKLLVAATLAAAAIFAVAGTSTALADSDPTMDQIYTAAAGGHLDQAQQMITQVLADHPTSAKAHYVQAELFAKQGKTSLARSELATAEQLKPGLPFANPRSVQELKGQLGLRTGTFGSPTVIRPVPAERRFPWGTVLVLAGVVAVLWMLFRRRRTYSQYPAAGAAPGGPGDLWPRIRAGRLWARPDGRRRYRFRHRGRSCVRVGSGSRGRGGRRVGASLFGWRPQQRRRHTARRRRRAEAIATWAARTLA